MKNKILSIGLIVTIIMLVVVCTKNNNDSKDNPKKPDSQSYTTKARLSGLEIYVDNSAEFEYDHPITDTLFRYRAILASAGVTQSTLEIIYGSTS